MPLPRTVRTELNPIGQHMFEQGRRDSPMLNVVASGRCVACRGSKKPTDAGT